MRARIGNSRTKYSCKARCQVRLTCRPVLGTLAARICMIKCRGSGMHIADAIFRTRAASRD
jgi:hypothetical protein